MNLGGLSGLASLGMSATTKGNGSTIIEPK